MAELRPHYIDVDLKKNTQYNVPVVTQNDTATHFIIRVTDDGLSDPELLDAYQEITMTSQRPDGESFYLTGTRIPGTNEIEFHLGTDETAFSGSVLASLQFYLVEDASRYTSAQFRYDVKKDLTKNYTPTQREETLVEVVLRDGPGVIQEAREAKQAVDGALVDLEQDKTAAIDRLDEVTEENKTVFRQPVNTFADLATTYPNPERGTTVRVTSEAASYRYSDGTWVKTDEYNPTAIDQVTAQLAETGEEIIEQQERLTGKNFKERKAYFTLHDDDAKADFMTKIKPVLDARGLKCGVAINPGYIGLSDFMTWADVEQLHAEGYEILNHGWTGVPPENLTLEELQANYELEKEAFLSHGIDTYDYYVYSGVMPWADSELKAKLQKVYKCCFAIENAPTNNIPFDSYAISRVSLIMNSERKLKIDETAENNGFLVGFGHSWAENYTVQALEEMLDYIQSKGFTYITTKEAIDEFSNSVELGNNGGDYFYADKNGNIDFSYMGESFIELYKSKPVIKKKFFENIPLTNYKRNVVTVEPISHAVALSLGLPDAGLMETFRYRVDQVSTNEYFYYQRYTQFRSSRVYVRDWRERLGVWCWYPFKPLNNANLASVNRPRYSLAGDSLYDTTLTKPIWCKTEGFQKNKDYSRNTAYNAGDVVPFSGSYMLLCTVAGTTSGTAPTFTTTEPMNDGTAQFVYVGRLSEWIDATGATV